MRGWLKKEKEGRKNGEKRREWAFIRVKHFVRA
jgi:hypothetical protein